MGKSGIHIKKSHKGLFTKSAKAAGESVQEHASEVLANPNASATQKKRANFARNAAKWHHEDGSKKVMKYTGGSKSLKKKQQSEGESRFGDSGLSRRQLKVQSRVADHEYDVDDKGVYRKGKLGKSHVRGDEAYAALTSGKVNKKAEKESKEMPETGTSGKTPHVPKLPGLVTPSLKVKPTEEPGTKAATSGPKGKYIGFKEMSEDQQKQYRTGIASGKDFEVSGIGKYKGSKGGQVAPSQKGKTALPNTKNFASGGEQGNFGTAQKPLIAVKKAEEKPNYTYGKEAKDTGDIERVGDSSFPSSKTSRPFHKTKNDITPKYDTGIRTLKKGGKKMSKPC